MTRNPRSLLILIVFLVISGCGVSLRPVNNQTYNVVEPGDPIQIADLQAGKSEKVIVKGKTIKGGTVATQDITAWIAMPPSHWRIVADALKQYAKDHPNALTVPEPPKP